MPTTEDDDKNGFGWVPSLVTTVPLLDKIPSPLFFVLLAELGRGANESPLAPSNNSARA